jgi:hypothetical protein
MTGKREWAASMTVGDDLVERVVDVDDVHLGPRHHDVGNAGFGGGEGAFDDGQRIGVQQVALVGRMQHLHQLLAVFRFAQQQRGQAFDETRFTVTVHNV